MMITVKASPEIGRTYGETVCVAGIRIDVDPPRWIRLFPVQWQWFRGSGHPKYQVIDVEVRKHQGDQRPESHRPTLDTVLVVREKSSAAQRLEVLSGLPQYTMCDLVAAKGWGRPSLGLVVPSSIDDFTWDDQSSDPARAKKLMQSWQGNLLDQKAPTLEFCPFVFRYRYHCLSPTCNGHRQTIVDWEISGAWHNWRKSYPDDFLDRIRTKVDESCRGHAPACVLRWKSATGTPGLPRSGCGFWCHTDRTVASGSRRHRWSATIDR